MRKSAVTLTLLAALLGAGCGAGDGGAAGRASGAASGLAVRADGVAAALDAGQCDAALAEARALQADLAAADLAPEVRAEALAGTIRVVNGIVCAPTTTTAPPTTTTATVAPVVRSGDNDKKGKGRKGDGDDD